MGSSLALPVLAALIAAVSLFTDVRTPIGKVSAVLLGVLLIFACFFQIQKNKEDKVHIAYLTDTLQSFEQNTEQSFGELKQIVRSYGNTDPDITAEKIKISFEADSYRRILASEDTESSRSNVMVEYFVKKLDKNIVKDALGELGFQVEEKMPKIPNAMTNAIFYGKDVPENAVKLVAATLVRAGVELKYIGPFLNSDGREMRMQIVHREKSKNNAALTLEQIHETKLEL